MISIKKYKQVVFLLMMFCFLFNINIGASEKAVPINYNDLKSSDFTQTTDVEVTKEVYTIAREEAIYLQKTNFTGGLYQDRQDLGIILPPGASITVWQSNPNYTSDINLKLLSDDFEPVSGVNPEVQFSIPADGTPVVIQSPSTSVATVPFIETPIVTGSEKPTINYIITPAATELPIYHYGGDVDAFFNTWDNNSSEFAILDSQYMQVLVPEVDKESLRNIDTSTEMFNTIDEALAFYNDYIEFCYMLIGLEENPTNETDTYVYGKYFIRADKDSYAWAYYTEEWVALNDSTLWDFFEGDYWLLMHEIAHGMESDFMNNGEHATTPNMNMEEMLTNVYARIYEEEVIKPNFDFYFNWLYGVSRQDDDEKYHAAIANGVTYYSDMGISQEYFWIQIYERYGYEWFIEINQMDRACTNDSVCNEKMKNYSNAEKYVLYLSEALHLNFIPYFEYWGIEINDDVKYYLDQKDYSYVFVLNQVVSDQVVIDEAISTYNLASEYSLVSTSDIMLLSDQTTTSDVTINITIDNFDEIIGRAYYIKDGDTIIASGQITSSQIYISDLEYGVYNIVMPSTKTNSYYIEDLYLVVEETTETFNLEYLPYSTNQINNEMTFSFYGYAHFNFMNLYIDLQNMQAVIEYEGEPQPYPMPGVYAGITIYDQNGAVVEDVQLEGEDVQPDTTLTIPLDYGYTIDIYHAEGYKPNYFYATDYVIGRDDNFTMTGSQTNISIEITPNGIALSTWDAKTRNEKYLETAKLYIETLASEIPTELVNNGWYYKNERNQINAIINNLEEPYKTQAAAIYVDYTRKGIPIITTTPIILEQNTTNVEWLSYATVIDLEDETIDLEYDATNVDLTTPGTYQVTYSVVDSDENVVTKTEEVQVTATLVIDTDSDGLNDDEELDLGTDPLNPDTDGDNVSDYEEVVNGTDPLTPPSNPKPPIAVKPPPISTEPIIPDNGDEVIIEEPSDDLSNSEDISSNEDSSGSENATSNEESSSSEDVTTIEENNEYAYKETESLKDANTYNEEVESSSSKEAASDTYSYEVDNDAELVVEDMENNLFEIKLVDSNNNIITLDDAKTIQISHSLTSEELDELEKSYALYDQKTGEKLDVSYDEKFINISFEEGEATKLVKVEKQRHIILIVILITSFIILIILLIRKKK